MHESIIISRKIRHQPVYVFCAISLALTIVLIAIAFPREVAREAQSKVETFRQRSAERARGTSHDDAEISAIQRQIDEALTERELLIRATKTATEYEYEDDPFTDNSISESPELGSKTAFRSAIVPEPTAPPSVRASLGRELPDDRHERSRDSAASDKVGSSKAPDDLTFSFDATLAASRPIADVPTNGDRTKQLPDSNTMTLEAPNQSTEPATPSTSYKSLPIVYELNPVWSEGSDALARVQLELVEMLQVYTEEHPLVQGTKLRIDQLERQLLETPRFITIETSRPSVENRANDQPMATNSPLPDDNPIVNQSASLSALSATVGANHRQDALVLDVFSGTAEMGGDPVANSRLDLTQSKQYQQLTDRIAELRLELTNAMHLRNAQSSTSTSTGIWLAEPAHITSMFGTTSASAWDLIPYLIPAVALGLAAAFVRLPPNPPTTLYDLGDVQRVMGSGTKLLGTIPTPVGPSIPSPREMGPPRTIQWIVLGSEIVCVTAAVILVVSVLQIPSFLSKLRENPISGFLSGVDFVMQFVQTLI